jgi:hypothetical protein
MDLVSRDIFEQAVIARLVQWEKTRQELERRMGQSVPAPMDRVVYQIEKLQAKYAAAIAKLKELDPSVSEDRFRISGSPPPGSPPER